MGSRPKVVYAKLPASFILAAIDMDVWPKISDSQSAMEAAHWSAGICFFIGIVTALASVIALASGHPVLGIDGWGLVDSGLFAFFGWRIWKLSRTVAILALLFYCAEVAYKLSETGKPGNPILMILFILGLTHGIRGTFAYRRFSISTLAPTDPESEAAMVNPIKRNWKRWVVIGTSAGIGIVAAFSGLIWAAGAYKNRPTDVRNWPTVQLSGTAAKADLKTQWRDGLHYVLIAAPSSSEYEEPFEKATKDLQQISLSFLLYDKGGFQLCKVDVDSLTVDTGNEGKSIGLESNGETSLCSADDYRQAASWNVNYRFPKLVTFATNEVVIPPPQPHSRTFDLKSKGPSEGEDTVTGYDFQGHLDAKDAQFYVARSGEQISASSWNSGTKILYECDPRDNCVLQNQTSGGTLHARRIR